MTRATEHHTEVQATAPTQNGRPLAEALGTPAVIPDQSPSPTGDESKHTLTLIRVQAEHTDNAPDTSGNPPVARTTRGVVRFLSDLTQRVESPIPVVAQCDECGRFWNPSVDLTDADAPIVLALPDNCVCGRSLDTPEMLRDLIGTARYYAETASRGGLI